jgi:hypothetical protein
MDLAMATVSLRGAAAFFLTATRSTISARPGLVREVRCPAKKYSIRANMQ